MMHFTPCCDDGKAFLKEGDTFPLPSGVGYTLKDTCKWEGNRDACGNETCWDLEECQNSPSKKVAILHLIEEPKKYCDCEFIMLMRDSKTDIAYCANCEREVLEGVEQTNTQDVQIELDKRYNQAIEELPDFLYKDDGYIKIGRHGDSDVTIEWIDFLNKLKK
jgi:hypothetical protein